MDKPAEIFAELTTGADPWAWVYLAIAIMAAAITGLSPSETRQRTFSRDTPWIQCQTAGTMPLFGFVLYWFGLWAIAVTTNPREADSVTWAYLGWWGDMVLRYWSLPIAGLALGLVLRFYVVAPLVAWFSNWRKGWRAEQEVQALTDIRDELGKFRPKTFTPSAYYKTGQVFFGLDQRNKPVYIPVDAVHGTHLQIIGPTGSGKGVALQTLVEQAILRGELVMIVDPGEDDNLRDVMYQTARGCDRTFVYYDMTGGRGGWDPFASGPIQDRRARLVLSLGIADSDRESDFYSGAERNMLDRVLASNLLTLGQMVSWMEAHITPDKRGKAYQRLKEMSLSPAFNPKPGRGFDIERSALNNAVVYVRTRVDNDPLLRAAARAMLLEIKQTLDRLYREGKRATWAFVLFDEAKYLVSKPLVDGLALLRKRQICMGIAHQDALDMRSIDDPRMDRYATESAVKTNTQIKLIYRQGDADAADWAASQTGTKYVTVLRSEQTSVAPTGGERWDQGRMLQKSQVPYIEANSFQALQPRVGVLLAPGRLAQVTYTCWVPVTKPFRIQPVSIETAEAAREAVEPVRKRRRKAIGEVVEA